jgi:hypothetical protein
VLSARHALPDSRIASRKRQMFDSRDQVSAEETTRGIQEIPVHNRDHLG